MVATAMGLEVRSIETTVEGDLDLRGTLGLDREVGAGFAALRLRFAVDAPDATQEQLDALLRKTERYCTVAQSAILATLCNARCRLPRAAARRP